MMICGGGGRRAGSGDDNGANFVLGHVVFSLLISASGGFGREILSSF